MNRRLEFWKRGRSHVWHAFTEDTNHEPDGEPRWDCLSLCERHEFTKDRKSVYLYTPWMGDDFPPDSKMCKKCLVGLERAS